MCNGTTRYRETMHGQVFLYLNDHTASMKSNSSNTSRQSRLSPVAPVVHRTPELEQGSGRNTGNDGTLRKTHSDGVRHNERGLQPRIRCIAAAARARGKKRSRLLAAAAATNRLVIEERTTTKCVLTSVSCVMAVAMLAWCPREHTRAPHIEDDRVQKEGALQPRLVPLRARTCTETSRRARCRRRARARCRKRAPLWIDTKRLFGPEHRDESAVLIIVLHTSSVHHQCLSPFVQHKNAKINSDREIIMAIFRNSRVFCEVPVILGRNWRSK